MSKLNISIAAIALIALATGIYVQQNQIVKDDLPTLSKVIILPKSKPLSGVKFEDHKGQPFSQKDFEGSWTIIFFGFTNCPDICPTTMHTLKQIKQQMTEQQQWGNYQVVMVSVDPERDSIERLANYVPFFDQDFIGLRSDLKTTTDFAKQVGILFVAHEEGENGGYDVDHSTSMILLNPQGQWAGVISAPHQAAEISQDLMALAKHYPEDHQLVSLKPSSNSAANTPVSAIDDQSASRNGDELTIEDAWIRPAPANAPSMAAYLDLVNSGTESISITGISSPDFNSSMIHATTIENDVASMDMVDELTIPAGGRISLAPLGTHLMLMGPKKEFEINDTAAINFHTSAEKTISVNIPVREDPISSAR